MKIEIEKPVIPQFVADWIDKLETKGNSEHSAFSVSFGLNMSLGIGSVLDDRVYDWFVNNKDDFVAAVRYGYEVEKESFYYAKVKGWELLDDNFNWVYLKNSKEFILGEVTFNGAEIDVMTKEEWNDLGINDTNADFEEVEVWEVDLSETYKNSRENGE